MGWCLRLYRGCVNRKLENSFSFAHFRPMLTSTNPPAITPAQIRAQPWLVV